jgi:hypothetical protein
MNNINIESSTLPYLGVPTKNMINQGIWFLYRVKNSRNSEIVFLLVTDEKNYFLNSSGLILSESINKYVDVDLENVVYFSDLPSPKSISNFQFA